MSPESGWPNASVRELHAAVSTPRAVLAELVRRATDARLDQVDRIVDGYENEVYRVRTTERHDVVVRIGRFGGNPARSAGEALAIERARAVGVPAPEVLLHDTLRIDGGEFPVMVQRTAPGRPLGDVYDTLSATRRHQVLVEIGELIARLNGVPANGDWATTMTAEIAKRRGDLVMAAGFSVAEFDRMIGLLEAYVDQFPCPEPVLCHGDLGPKHIFVDDSVDDAARVTGVIDFGDWQPGAPVHDLAVLRVRGPRLDLAPLLQGYGPSADPSFRRALDLNTLYIALPSMEMGVEENDDACVRRTSAVIRTVLDAV